MITWQRIDMPFNNHVINDSYLQPSIYLLKQVLITRITRMQAYILYVNCRLKIIF